MSDLSQGAASFLDPALMFTADTRLYSLETPPGTRALLVESFVGREALSALYEYHIDCLSTDGHIELKTLLGKQVTLSTRLADGAQSARSGYVSAVAQLGSDGGLARYRLTVVPWLALARYQRRSRVFQDIGVLDLISEVLAGYHPHHNWRITPEADAVLAGLRPRSYCCQYRESDFDFLSRILTEEGIGFYFEEDESGNTSAARQRLVLFSDSTGFPDDKNAAANGGIRFHRNAAVEKQDTIQALGAERQLQAATTTIATWDYKAKRVIATSLPTAHAYGGANAPRIESYDWTGVYAFANQDEAEHYARILREAADARLKTWFGNGSVRTFRAGSAFKLTGSPLDQRYDVSSGKTQHRFTLLGVLHAGVNNLSADMKHALATRLDAPPMIDTDEHEGSDNDSAAAHLSRHAWEELLVAAEATG